MELSGLKFILKDINEITIKDRDFLTETFHKLFVKIYGADVVDALNQVTKTSAREIISNNEGIKYLATNYKNVLELIKSL